MSDIRLNLSNAEKENLDPALPGGGQGAPLDGGNTNNGGSGSGSGGSTGGSDEEGNLGRRLKNAPKVPLADVFGVEVTSMPEVTRAGVELTKFILGIAAGTIVLLVSYLILEEIRTQNNVKLLYRSIAHQSASAQTDEIKSNINHLISQYISNKTDRNDNSLPGLWTAINKSLLKLDVPPNSDVDKFISCHPLPEGNEARNKTIEECISALYKIKTALDDWVRDRDNSVKSIGEFLDKERMHQKTFKEFWIQAAQLILLNLFLPLLTAMLGYLFGNGQQASSNPTKQL